MLFSYFQHSSCSSWCLNTSTSLPHHHARESQQRRWDDNGRIFVPLHFDSDMPAMDFDTGEQPDIGNFTVTLRGKSIAAVRFQYPWQQT
jgi:hypothetical protein